MFENIISKIPTQPPRSPALLPGLALTTSFSKTMLLPLAFMAMFTLIPLSMILNESKSQLTNRNSKTADGVVISVAVAPRTQDDHEIIYAFTPAGGSEHRGSCKCSKGSAYYDLKPGDHVPVKYLPSNPSLNKLGDMVNDTNGPPVFVFIMFPLFGLLILVPMLGPQISELWKARKIFKVGQIGKGAVFFIKRKASPSWPTYAIPPAEIFVSYQLTSGKEVEGRALCSNDWLLAHLPPGANVNIAFIESKPNEIVLLDAYIR
jgi:hypothetical protein